MPYREDKAFGNIILLHHELLTFFFSSKPENEEKEMDTSFLMALNGTGLYYD